MSQVPVSKLERKSTSVNLSSELHRQAKIAAICEEKTLGEWVEQAIAERLNKRRGA